MSEEWLRLRNLALEAPRLEIIKVIKVSNKEMRGFRGLAQIGKSI